MNNDIVKHVALARSRHSLRHGVPGSNHPARGVNRYDSASVLLEHVGVTCEPRLNLVFVAVRRIDCRLQHLNTSDKFVDELFLLAKLSHKLWDAGALRL